MAAEIHDEHGSLDVVMNIAGIAIWGTVETLSHEQWQRVIDVNLMGPIHVVECFVPPMIAARRGGHLVNVSSAAGIFGLPWHAPYSTTKFGLRGLSEVLRFDLRRHDIGVQPRLPRRRQHRPGRDARDLERGSHQRSLRARGGPLPEPRDLARAGRREDHRGGRAQPLLGLHLARHPGRPLPAAPVRARLHPGDAPPQRALRGRGREGEVLTVPRPLVTLVAAGALALAAAAPAHAAQESQDLRFVASDGVSLQTTITGEAPLTARPTLVEFSPYGRDSGTLDPGPDFNSLLVQIRGTGDSDGGFDALGPRTQADVAEVTRWACDQPWSDGNLALNGFSASAITIYNSLHHELPCVRAGILKSGTHELYRDLIWPGGVSNLVPAAAVMGLIGMPSLVQGPDRLIRDPASAVDVLAGLARVRPRRAQPSDARRVVEGAPLPRRRQRPADPDDQRVLRRRVARSLRGLPRAARRRRAPRRDRRPRRGPGRDRRRRRRGAGLARPLRARRRQRRRAPSAGPAVAGRRRPRGPPRRALRPRRRRRLAAAGHPLGAARPRPAREAAAHPRRTTARWSSARRAGRPASPTPPCPRSRP